MTPFFSITKQLNKWLKLFMRNAKVFDILLFIIRSKNIHITPCYPWADPNIFSRVVVGKFKFPVGGGWMTMHIFENLRNLEFQDPPPRTPPLLGSRMSSISWYQKLNMNNAINCRPGQYRRISKILNKKFIFYQNV